MNKNQYARHPPDGDKKDGKGINTFINYELL